MEKQEIRKQISNEVNKWIALQEKREKKVIFSPKAIDFMCTMIENIEDDRSNYWNYDQTDNRPSQEFAISLIPNALNDLTVFRGFGRFPFKKREIYISTWEIWHSLSEIVDKFCFIPKN